MLTFLEGYPYGSNRAALAPPASDHVDARVLAAGVAETHTVPAGARYVVFSATADFYAKFGAAAAVPAADVTNGTASALNPTQRRIPDGATTIGLIAPAACVVTLSFWG